MDNFLFYFQVLGFAVLFGIGTACAVSVIGFTVDAILTILKKL